MKAEMAERTKRAVYMALVCALALAMPNLKLGMSIASILLLAYSFYYPGFRSMAKIKENLLGLMLIGLFALHLLWLWNTSDWAYAFKDLRIKLPLLLLPVVLGAFEFRKRDLQFIFLALSVGVWIACIVAYYNYLFFLRDEDNFRSIVQGISPVRLALLMSVLTAGILALWKDLNTGWRIYASLCLLNVLCFFNLIQSATGVIAVLIIILVGVGYRLGLAKRPPLFAGFLLSILMGLAVSAVFTRHYYQRYFTSAQSITNLPITTPYGNDYEHLPDAGIVENGDYTFNYICRSELINTWNERSEKTISAADGWTVATLIRYLSSKGLSKDRDGVLALSDFDIAQVEAGVPSVIYLKRHGLARRFHVLLMGYHIYERTGDASGYSFFQRVIYWQLAGKIIDENFWLGVGTGDVKAVFNEAYDRFQPTLEPSFRNRAHNQYFTFFISFGVLGFAYFVIMAFVAIRNTAPSFMPVAVMLILFLSCLTEDTLESQAGVTFFAFFYSLFARKVDILNTA